MRQTLRRSCDACAKSNNGCDLGTPRCLRCAKRQMKCIYANEPLTLGRGHHNGRASKLSRQRPNDSINGTFGSFDPFDSYPQTRLPRQDVQRLIHAFLHKIAVQYYPPDLSAACNPFLVSWWPLALGDAALFHVSLQTACLDEERRAQKGFQKSELLMADSVELLRRKVQVVSSAVQDGTMNSVITLAAIEFGKGNLQVSKMHVEGVKQLVKLRGGIGAVWQTSPLTGRMVSWVSMILVGHPQFQTQDNTGCGHGIPTVPEWRLETPGITDGICDSIREAIDSTVLDALLRLRNISRLTIGRPLKSTRLHDISCFTIHRLLPTVADLEESPASPMSECLRNCIILYMLVVQGTTYYSHHVILDTILSRLKTHIGQLWAVERAYSSFDVWFMAIGMIASVGTRHYSDYCQKARILSDAMKLNSEVAQRHVRNVLWQEWEHIDGMHQPHWDALFCRRSNDALAEKTENGPVSMSQE